MVWIENKSFDLHKASRTLLYFLEQEKTSSDVELFIAKIDQRLRELKIAIVETPSGLTQGQEFLVNEDGIYGSIVKVYSENNRFFDKDDKDHTIKQDVKSICATYRLRQGRKPRNLKDVECIFITTNPSLARAAKQFEIEENGGGKGFIPTVLTDIFVGTIVWLNTPVAVMKVNEKRLIANCYAALQPSKDMIRMLVEKAEKMNDEGEIRDEDVALLKISRVARNILQKNTLGDLERFDNVNISAIVRQTRLDIRNEERESFENDREEALHKVRDAEAKVALAEKERKAANSEKIKMTERLDDLSNKITKWIAGFIYVLALISVAWGTVFTLFPDSFLNLSLLLKIVSYAFAILLSGASIMTGFNLRDFRNYINEKIKKIIDNVLLG